MRYKNPIIRHNCDQRSSRAACHGELSRFLKTFLARVTTLYQGMVLLEGLKFAKDLDKMVLQHESIVLVHSWKGPVVQYLQKAF